MSSMDLDAPPLRSILMAIFIVVGLHVLTAVALVAIKPAAPKVELVKETPPIEIEMISLAATLPVESEAVEVELQEAAPKPQPISKPKPKPEQKSKEQKLQEKKPDTAARVKQEKTAAVNKEKPLQKKTQQENKLQEKKQHPNIDKAIADQQRANEQRANEQRANEQRSIVAAQAEKAAQEAYAQTVQDAKRLADAKNARDAQADAKAAKEAAELSASKEAEAAARAKAKAAAAANDTPVNFTASNANWSSAPNFNFPDRAARRAHSGDTFNVVLVLRVNKQGGIDSVRIAQSSGNAILDKEAQRQVRSGKFKPFMKNGAAVVGNVTLPIAYTVP